MTTPTAVPEPLSAEGAALLDAGLSAGGRRGAAPGRRGRRAVRAGPARAGLPRQRQLARRRRVAGPAGGAGPRAVRRPARAWRWSRSATASAPRRRCGWPSSPASSPRPTTWRSCCATRDRLGEAVQVLVRAAEAGDPQAGGQPRRAAPGGRRPARPPIEAAERYADESRPETLGRAGRGARAAGPPDEAEPLYRRAGAARGAACAHRVRAVPARGARGRRRRGARVPGGRSATPSRAGRSPSAGSCSTTGAGDEARPRTCSSRSTAATGPRPTRSSSWTGGPGRRLRRALPARPRTA